MVYDLTDPARPQFVTYTNNRDFSVAVDEDDFSIDDLADAGDLGPESVSFISGDDSPTGRPLVAVGNEVSGTTTLLDVSRASRAGKK